MNFVVMALMMVGMMVFMHGRGHHSDAHGNGSQVQAAGSQPAVPGVPSPAEQPVPLAPVGEP